MKSSETNNLFSKIRKLDTLLKNLSKEKRHTALLEHILFAIKDMTSADGGTLYLPTDKKTLKFEIVTNDSLKLKMGGTSNVSIAFKDINIYDDLTGKPNMDHIACSCFINKEIINIDDAYDTTNFNFTGSKRFDIQTGYKTKSILAVPLIDVHKNVIGVIQLVNATNHKGVITNFSDEDIAFAEFLSSHAAITVTNFKLTKDLTKLFESLAKVIATAIDDKSPYTGNHCYRVPEITMMITEEAIKEASGPLKNFSLSEDQVHEMKLAALLHDCGKVSTPVHVIDKATKLETITDRIETIETRFEVVKRDAEIEFLKKKIDNLEGRSNHNLDQAKIVYHKKMARYKLDFQFLQKSNIGTEYMPKEDQEKVIKISQHKWSPKGMKTQNIITENEITNLNIPKGTLTEEEKQIINHHIVMTAKMLDQLDFPEHLKNIPEIASNHHEKLNGKGYPKGLKDDQISMQARIIGISDIFEALTAQDRPYKKGKTLSETLFILGKMVEDNELDQGLFNLMIDKQIYLDYANRYLDPYQIDEVIINNLPGYTGIYKNIDIKKAA